MRSLTRAQATVLLSLLDAGLEPERRREEGSGLARTTYQDAKRRLYAEGCLEDRYLPHPALLGVRTVQFRLARPFADRLEEEARLWAETPGAIVVWKGTQSLFGVFFARQPGETFSGSLGRGDAPRRERKDRGPGRETAITVPTHAFSLPAYFDYEGALARFTGVWVPRGYPRSFGGPLVDGRSPRLLRAALRRPEVLSALVRRPFQTTPMGRPGHLVGPTSLPRSQRQLLLSGLVDWRPMPNIERLPPFRGRRLQSLAFIHGKLREGARPSDLFRALVGRVGSHPFLYVTDSGHVLLATLLVGSVRVAPEAASTTSSGESALGVLRESLGGIDILREPIDGLRVLVNHRYDRLVP